MKRSKHNLSHYRLLSCDMGQLVPCGLVEVLPGDTFQHGTSAVVRANPMVTPPMHPVSMRVHHWFVPHRLIWNDFEKFITGGPDGLDATEYPVVALTDVENAEKSVFDYLGVPSGFGITTSALPLRAYNLIFNEWYRDQDLITPLTINLGNGMDNTTSRALQKVAWEKDYFTTARPWEEKGPNVTVPVTGAAPVFTTAADKVFGAQAILRMKNAATGGAPGNENVQLGGGVGEVRTTGFGGPDVGVTLYPSNLEAQLNSGTAAIDISALRRALALQRFGEARARYGSRYVEYLRYLGVRSSDARLNRPEYLGGGRQALQFSEVLQTGTTTADPNGIGQLYGHGIGAIRSARYRRFFEEHGYVVSLMSVLPRTMYPQGLARTWNRRQKEDFFQKELELIGQQQVQNREIYAPNVAGGMQIFGYQDRYDEYRRMESSIHGEFRTSLSDWHFGRIFSAQPVLNAAFINADPAKRAFQTTTVNTLLVMVNHQLVARRIVGRGGVSRII